MCTPHALRSAPAGSSVPPLPDALEVAADDPLEGLRTGALVAGRTLDPGALHSLHAIPERWIPPRLRLLRCGAYLVNYTPSGSLRVTYDGTLRVECSGTNGRRASGDLYQRQVRLKWLGGLPHPLVTGGPSPARGIPILPRSRYRYYLRVTHLLPWITLGNGFTLRFEMHRFNLSNQTWSQEAEVSARMSWEAAPPGYPSASDFLAGDVRRADGRLMGRLTMGWVSSFLRKCTVEVDRVSASEAPLANAAGLDWKEVGERIGWDIRVDESDHDVEEPSGASWSNAELHDAMLEWRKQVNLDREWRYHVLAVRQLDATSRGIMYDAFSSDSNNVPREGCAISSHWVTPDTNAWGTERNRRFGLATDPYFRTAVHEVGHCWGLYHNTVDNGYMNTTDVIVNAASSGNPFPGNIGWDFAEDDARRLRHMPDVYVRPGGTPFGTSYASTPISAADSVLEQEELSLRVTGHLDAFPLGAPVRVNLELVNTGDQPVAAPSSLSLARGFVRGRVLDASGTERSFSPLYLCVDEEELRVLEPGERITNSLTLLRGVDGALFPSAGPYTIHVEAHWEAEGIQVGVSGETRVMVEPPVDTAHARAALKLLSTPDALLTLVLGGDHLPEGMEAIQAGLAHPVLRPHFAHIEAKRLAERFRGRKPDLAAAAKLLDEHTVLTPAEVRREAEIVQGAGKRSKATEQMASVLKARVKGKDVDADLRQLVDGL